MKIVRYQQPQAVFPRSFLSPWFGAGDEFERFVDRTFASLFDTEARGLAGDHPRVDLYEDKDNFHLRVELPGIYFDFNSAALTPASDRTIAFIAAILTRHPDWTATLEGHTDSIGSAAANRALSQRRVEGVRERLVSAHHLNPATLRTTGYGSSRPRETNGTVEGRARNRRVELVRDCEKP